LILGVLTAASLAAVPFWLILSPPDSQAVLINTLWCLFNLLLVVAALLVAFEQPQLRSEHRLTRQIPIVLHSDTLTLWGTTVNISESGALIQLDEFPNTADEVRIEITGDYGAKVLVEAQIVRAIATADFKTQIAVQFLNLTQAQKDDLSVLLFSDVDEWFSQERTEMDRPFESLRFIASSLRRVFQEFQPALGMKVRQAVKAPTELSWEGWGDCVYSGTLLELGYQDLRLEVEYDPFLDLAGLNQGQPILGLLVQPWSGCEAQSLLAQVRAIDFVEDDGVNRGGIGMARRDRKVILELTIPETMRRFQKGKVKQLLQALGAS
jgi:cellulose synthase (UDP-forming)